MTSRQIVKLTNRMAVCGIVLLIYWTFIFICITVFDFKVFRENLTQAFFMSVMAILAMLGGAVIVNVIVNLSRIADHVDPKPGSNPNNERTFSRSWMLGLLSFPLIFCLLWLGDMASTTKKHQHLIESAEQLLTENGPMVQAMSEYSFDKAYIDQTQSTLKVLSRVDESFPQVSLLLQDRVQGKPMTLQFLQYHYQDKLDRADFIYTASKDERIYLDEVFAGTKADPWFSAHDGFYELYYPVKYNDRTIVLYFTDRQRYGKIGS